MIKAVFFDLYNTLVCYEPSRESVQAGALRDLGIEVAPGSLSWPLVAADEFLYPEMARKPMGQRTPGERMKLWAEYERVLLREAGIKVDEATVAGLLVRVNRVRMEQVLFDDVLPALETLRGRGLLLGLISNVDSDLAPLLDRLGLTAWLQVAVTSLEAGATKPHPRIFWAALERAGVAAGEAIYVGDQYRVDVLGASGAGMKGVLLDRGDYFRKADCPRVNSLAEIVTLL